MSAETDRIIKNIRVPLWQHKREFAALLEWMRAEKIRSVLELGTGFGGSAYAFGEVTDHGVVVTVDLDEEGPAHVPASKRCHQPNPNLVSILGDSRSDEVQAQVETHGPFDMVYFDAEHSLETAVDHYRRYLSLARVAVVQHDTNMDIIGWAEREPELPGVVHAWEGLVSAGVFRDVKTIHDPDPDTRFPRWGGISIGIL